MKPIITYIVLVLLCLFLVACNGLEVAGKPEPAANERETTSNVIAIEPSPVSPAVATIMPTATAEIVATETAITEAASSESVPTGTAAAESADVPLESGIYAEGTAEILILPGCFDFDDGVSLAPPDPACDFNILPGPDSGTVEVYPIEPAQLAYGGVFPEAPTLAQCAESSAFSAEPEIVAPMAAMYVCYRTGEGRSGYLHFTDADLEQAGTLTFDWLTFAAEVGTLPRSLPHSGKGYELYSWQAEEDGNWRYTLITGTDRLKTVEELTSADNAVSDDGWVKVTVTGIDTLFDLLGRLPAAEQIFWRSEGWMPPEGAAAGQFRLPEQSVIAAVEQRCRELNLRLTVNAARAPAATGQVEPPPKMQLEAVLEMPQTLPSGTQVELTFTLTNYEAHPLYVLKWYTPLEGVAGEIFRVERNGQVLPYQGILAMRGDPGPEDYMLLQPGGSAVATVDLADAYDFSQAGTYTIEFIPPRISHVARTEAGMARTVDELGPVKIFSNTVTVTIGTGDGS